MNKPRCHFADQEKVSILKRYLLDKVPVSGLCDELDICSNPFCGICSRLRSQPSRVSGGAFRK